MSTATAVRWGFLGAGFVASRGMAPAVHAAAGAVLQVAGARDVERARSLEPVRVLASYDEVCDADDVDAVYISLPNNDHLPWVLRALAAGKHVLCEKPLALTADQVEAMAAAAAAADRLVVEAAWNRWHPRTRRVEELAAQLDGPRSVSAWFTFAGVPADNYRLDPRRGGGALLDVGFYAVSAAHWATGAREFAVSGLSRHVGPTGVDLTTTAVLTAGQHRADVTASFERAESQGLRIEASGTVIELGEQAFTSWRAPAELRITEDGVERTESFEPVDAYQLMVEAVSARVAGGDGWILPLASSGDVARTLDTIAASDPR